MKDKIKKSGPAIFMDIVIYGTIVIALICFMLYYFNVFKNGIILWTGIVTFTIWYQFWLRITLGNITKKIGIKHTLLIFKELPFEKKLYKFLRVKNWKDKVLTFEPEAFDLKKHTLEEIANQMSKAELDHWLNELISLSMLLFSLLWGQFWIFFTVCILAMIFDLQFIVIQRYNRPNVKRIMAKQAQLLNKKI